MFIGLIKEGHLPPATDKNVSSLAIESIAEETKGYDSVNLDFEGLGWNDLGDTKIVRQDLNTAQSYANLTAQGVELTLTLHRQTVHIGI